MLDAKTISDDVSFHIRFKNKEAFEVEGFEHDEHDPMEPVMLGAYTITTNSGKKFEASEQCMGLSFSDSVLTKTSYNENEYEVTMDGEGFDHYETFDVNEDDLKDINSIEVGLFTDDGREFTDKFMFISFIMILDGKTYDLTDKIN